MSRSRRRSVSSSTHSIGKIRCLVLLRDHLPAYIRWDRFGANVRRLDANRTNKDKLGPPREGPSLLSGPAALRPLWAAPAGSLQWAQEPALLRLYKQHFLLRRA